MKRGDKIMSLIFALLLLAALSAWAYKALTARPAVLEAVIMQDGKTVDVIKLKHGDAPKEYRLKSDAGYNVIRTEDGKIAVTESDCPDGDCVRRGWLTRPGDSSVCLPHKLVIRIRGISPIDGVTY